VSWQLSEDTEWGDESQRGIDGGQWHERKMKSGTSEIDKVNANPNGRERKNYPP
jgi:hypothetical protein